MFVYYVKIDYDSDISALSLLVPNTRRKPIKSTSFGPAYAYSLLLFALNRNYGINCLNSVRYTGSGKPFLSDRSDIHFSLSHTDTHSLVALSRSPVGADVQTIRPIIPSLPSRILDSGENPERFFDYWTLKESFIKLLGNQDRPLREISFSLTEDRAFLEDVQGYIYGEITGCSAAVCALGQFEKPSLTEVSLSELKLTASRINTHNNKNT